MQRVLDILVNHGAVEDILIEAHPHIGTNKLPKVVEAMRETIIHFGGEIHFDTRMDDLILKENSIKGIKTQAGDVIEADALILATGHSARDVFELLDKKKILIEAKPFAMGVRVEHPQQLINDIQYHGDRSGLLPAASYKLVEQVQDNQFANSGIVVAIELSDLRKYSQHGALAGLAYQKEVEQNVWKAGGSDQTAPAQKLTDFVKGKSSTNLNDTSYMPGLNSARMNEILPPAIADRLRQAFPKFGQKMKGYFTDEANIIGIESRTSSPVRNPRKRDTLQHPQIDNLFPCGEGAGYAGGIVSAGIDGENCAEAALAYLHFDYRSV